ncbi:MAG: hypothetical protein QF842_05555 [Candidatus Marinimicrobia bacterium]|jgi:uncharacterized membrane protein SirB2|nr:hypothetical protein [Candidatus Neomarinimicrobiota bacterium]MDP6611255.1 hypothetical protein [Candidatus Neomarinimicrobiota bacterium]|tara:strand:- start:129 stop:305 length:177 start_codon:yes stop_codon:yes gene_type:complete
MSLKSFHILFIILSIATTVWFGFWEWNQSVFWAIVSFLAGAGLVVYGIQVFKKFKTIS